MGVLNVTPDSFSDGGAWTEPGSALQYAREMAEAGASIIDVGGESTRPGSKAVSEAEEIRRVIPIIEAIRGSTPAISVDTSKPAVMAAAVAAGATMINDVMALRAPGALDTAAGLGVRVCLMHMQGDPRTMQTAPRYDDVVAEVEAFLLERAAACLSAGIARESIVLDPGFGFGKTLEHNLTLVRALPRLAGHGYCLLAGLSRKSMLATITGRDVDERLAGSLALALVAAQGGASILRVHDVGETLDVLRVLETVWPSTARGE
jgi:dihydropteroate synthase